MSESKPEEKTYYEVMLDQIAAQQAIDRLLETLGFKQPPPSTLGNFQSGIWSK